MKKSIYLIATIAICLFLCVGCKKEDSASSVKATGKTVLKYLPGKWKVMYRIDEKGNKSTFEGNMILEFGKQESETDFGSNHGSSLWGYCHSYDADNPLVIFEGTWNIEPDSKDKGVLFYIEGDASIPFRSLNLFKSLYSCYITQISDSSMRIENSDDESGIILSRL